MKALCATFTDDLFQVHVFFAGSYIIFRKTKQKIVALVAAAFKALLSVAQAEGGLAGRKLCAGNVYCPFWYALVHSSSHSI